MQNNIPDHISQKCFNNYGFDIEAAIEDRVIRRESVNSIAQKYNIPRTVLSQMFREIGVDTTHTELGQQHLIK